MLDESVATARQWLQAVDAGDYLAWDLAGVALRAGAVAAVNQRLIEEGYVTERLTADECRQLAIECDVALQAAGTETLCAIVRASVPSSREPGWGWAERARPAAPDIEAAIYVDTVGRSGKEFVVAQAVAVLMRLTPDGWRVAGFDAPAKYPAPSGT